MRFLSSSLRLSLQTVYETWLMVLPRDLACVSAAHSPSVVSLESSRRATSKVFRT
jgi:hypothetical protein